LHCHHTGDFGLDLLQTLDRRGHLKHKRPSWRGLIPAMIIFISPIRARCFRRVSPENAARLPKNAEQERKDHVRGPENRRQTIQGAGG
jgi:hypothetical protein